MPILPQEPCLFPDGLLVNPPDEAASAARWWVLHTRPRAEKSLARKLLDRGIPFFLPLYQHRWRNKGRLFQSQLPLFAGYLFLNGDEQARLHALETRLVANWLPVADQQRLHTDLARVYRLLATDQALTPENRLLPGTPVEIIAGPLTGLEGTVIRSGSQLRVFVAVHFLQQGVSAEVETWMIRPLRP